MKLRPTILIMSAFGVISDSILIAFYPQFFEARYGLVDSVHVGAYIAAISIAVMVMLPVWARVARRVETMHLLLYTQLVAALLCLAAAWAPTVRVFWVLTMLMYMTKASYLLLFPYLMRLEKPDQHTLVVGMLSVVLHIAGIFGAAVGGLILQRFGPQTCLWLMAAGDFLQMALCAYLISSGQVIKVLVKEPGAASAILAPRTAQAFSGLLKLSLLMLLFDFSAYLVRPFFTLYWETVTGIHQKLITGLVFAIPGSVALGALLLKRLRKVPFRYADHAIGNMLLGALGLALQAAPTLGLIILGRVFYGWALYQVVVKLEVSLFKLSTPDAYARDFAVTNFAQNLGVLLSSFAAGFLVSWVGGTGTFLIAAAGLLLTALVDHWVFGLDRLESPRQQPA